MKNYLTITCLFIVFCASSNLSAQTDNRTIRAICIGTIGGFPSDSTEQHNLSFCISPWSIPLYAQVDQECPKSTNTVTASVNGENRSTFSFVTTEGGTTFATGTIALQYDDLNCGDLEESLVTISLCIQALEDEEIDFNCLFPAQEEVPYFNEDSSEACVDISILVCCPESIPTPGNDDGDEGDDDPTNHNGIRLNTAPSNTITQSNYTRNNWLTDKTQNISRTQLDSNIDFKQKADLLIHPNPVSNILYINDSQAHTAKVYDINSRLLKSISVSYTHLTLPTICSV